MSLVIVERHCAEGLTFEDLQTQEEMIEWCLQLNSVAFRYSYLATDGTRMICVYEAPDADAVRRTQDEGKLPYTSIYSAHVVEPESKSSP